jgi:hypothetical protein
LGAGSTEILDLVAKFVSLDKTPTEGDWQQSQTQAMIIGQLH